MNNARATKSSTIRACLECQKRKTKCVPDRRSRSCIYCLRVKKPCLYEAAPSRTPLTRKNLDALEKRCSHLETLLRSLSQGIDVDAELEKLSHREIEPQDATRTRDETRDATPREGFEWNESPASAGPKDPHTPDHDGLASMAVESSGYLGSSSASSILQSISALFPKFDLAKSASDKRSPRSSKSQHAHSHSLVLNASLAADATTNRLVDAFFTCFNSSYPILHEGSFRKQREQRTRADSASSWTAIHALVLAIGQWILDEEPNESLYFAVARSWLSARALESGTLEAVQAFLLMGNYVQKRGRPNTGYNMIGIAYRMALGLGMHREITQGRQNTLLAEWRRRVFWTLFCFDSGLSITTGRPATVIDAFMDVRMPRNIDDLDLELDSPIPVEVDYPTPASAIIAHAHLAIIANEIHTKFWSLSSLHSETDHNVALTMEVKLFNWRNSLPRYFTSAAVPEWFLGPRAMVFWKEQHLRMMLWTSKRRHSTEAGKSVADLKCYAAAVETIQDVSVFCKENVRVFQTGLIWYMTYYLFQAIMVLEVGQVENSKASQPDMTSISNDGASWWIKAIEQGRSCLQLLSRPSSAASRCLETLDRIHSLLLLAPNLEHPSALELPRDLHALQQEPSTSVPRIDHGISAVVSSSAFDSSWSMSADPSLHMLLNDRQMDEVFRGVEGFPGTLDQDSFDYLVGCSFDF